MSSPTLPFGVQPFNPNAPATTAATPDPPVDATADMLAANGATPSQPSQPKRSALKSMLLNFAEGMGKSLQYQAGVPQFDQAQAQAQITQAKVPYAAPEAAANLQQQQAATQLTQAQAQQMQTMVDTPYGKMPLAYWKSIAPALIKGQSAEAVADKNNATKQSISDDKNQAARDIADQKLQSVRELTKAKIQASLGIAANHDKTALTAAQIRATVPMMREGMKSYDLALDSDNRYQQMIQQAKEPNPAGDKALLFNHIAMTLGNVKGGRVTQAEIEAHLKARDLGSEVMQAWDKVLTGKTLTAEQRQNFLKLATEVRDAAWDKAYRRADFYGVQNTPEDNPALPKAKTNVPKPGGNKVDSLLKKYGGG
jgi:hypothetical protein